MQRREFMRKVGLMGVIAATTPIPAFAVGPDGECIDPDGGWPFTDDNGMADIKLWGAMMGELAEGIQTIVGWALAALIVAAAVPSAGEIVEFGLVGPLLGIFLVASLAKGMFEYIEADPPRAVYQVQAFIASIDLSALDVFSSLGARGLAHLQALVDEIALLGAFLDAMELYQGAELAGDQKWMDIHTADAVALADLYNQNADRVTDAYRYVCAYVRQAIDPSIMHNELPTDAAILWKDPAAAAALAEMEPALQPILDPGGRKFDYKAFVHDGVPRTLRSAVNELDEIARQLCARRQGPIGCTV